LLGPGIRWLSGQQQSGDHSGVKPSRLTTRRQLASFIASAGVLGSGSMKTYAKPACTAVLPSA